ncbi:DNA polymerase III subunit alpha [Commensalibacter oyaizuii]|uniref:DNA polymerase III subunit alpha n=1 Tax=Commensalibacter oyaizuii TaxID=3043873 RepID=A0ABT6PZS2_9PROT|nr:DNA polymerase III subunit alpha [Commensalibacter sp. TBRC 16381]MDI2090365.1 DNA polymerase III subunit alpha [Commensalibacter sp. TBRC 16381]
MALSPFIHLRNHSAYSLSQGALRIPKMVALAKEMQMPALAITDTGNLFGALEFSKTCVDAGIQPIIGAQIGIPAIGENTEYTPSWPIVLLAQNEAGLLNLQFLSSEGFLKSDPADPAVSVETLCQHSEGLILLTGGTRGPIFKLLADGQEKHATDLLEQWAKAFPNRLVVELNRHNLPDERSVEPGVISLADRFGLPLVATNECFFPTPELYEAHDALICIAQGCTVDMQDRWKVTPEHWFKPPQMMAELFADVPEAISNTLEIAKRCAVKVETRKPMLPQSRKIKDGMTADETLQQMAQAGLEDRFKTISDLTEDRKKEYQERLEYEISVIQKMGFPGYFLIVADFIQWAKEHNIPVGPGRGSGAGSLVAWALTITDLDPLRFQLLFERFLNPERVSMPDFDIDFCQDRRDEVIEYVRHAYGLNQVAQIITFGKLQARAAVRDVGRVLGLPFGMVNKVAELIPNNPASPVTLGQAIATEPRLQEMRDSDENIKRLLEVALQLEGLYRHAGTHAAGVVIGDRPLVELVPLYRDPRSDMLVTQYNMKFVEQVGLVKFDFLGLTTLTILQRAVNMLEKLGQHIDLSTIPLDDKLTYEMLSRGESGGVFQFEGAGMRDVLRQMQPSRIEDLIAAVALYRPGPMANIPDYCRRKHGEKWEPPHEMIRDVLEETYGIMVYQEQVMQIAQKMAKYSLGSADLLRRAMGKKIRSEMDTQREIFTKGAVENGIEQKKAIEIFDLMAKFADYGFNKSHAAAYALVSYQTAWMKANYPVAFFAACMSLAIEKTDKLAVLRQEAKRINIEVLPPDINKSGADFEIEQQADGSYAIRYALAAIKRAGYNAMEALVTSRGRRPFKDLVDFAERIDCQNLNKGQLENLAKSGAFDSIEPNRHKVFAAAEVILRRAHARKDEKSSGQIGLFQVGGEKTVEPLKLPAVSEWPEIERLTMEAEAIGYHMTAHPLDSFRSLLSKMGIQPGTNLEQLARSGVGRVKIAGCILNCKERPTRKGTKMAWVGLSDKTGACEVTFFSESLARYRDLLVAGRMVIITVDMRMDEENLRITAQHVEDLEDAIAGLVKELKIWVKDLKAVEQISNVLENTQKGRGRIVLVPQCADQQEVEVILPDLYNVSPILAQHIKVIHGVEKVEQY